MTTAEEREKLRKDPVLQEQIDDLKQVVSTPAGIRFFRRMREDAHLSKAVFTGNSQTFYNLGARDLALIYLNQIDDFLPHKGAEIKYGREVLDEH